jgi:hypothetical protein
MIRSRAAIDVEPSRIVVELSREQFEALDRASGRVAPADYLRAVALRLAELANEPARRT